MKRKIFSILFALVLVCSFSLVTAVPVAAAVTVETVPVGNPGNVADTTGYGTVAYAYNIGKYEVTAGQYTEFLNAVAGTDTHGLYNTSMWSSNYGCKIERTDTGSGYSYNVASDWANRPVNFVSFWDACRFANWLHNGQGSGGTETGAYTLTADGITDNIVTRNEGWQWAVTSEDEWCKAAYYKNDGMTGNYFGYPTASDSMPSNDLLAPDGGNNANFWQDGGYTIGSPYYRTLVGEFELSESPYGTFDQGGNVREWNEAGVGSSYRYQRGGDFAPWMGAPDGVFLGAALRGAFLPTVEGDLIGFRVVQTVPVWVDDDYTADSCGGHTWLYDAFAAIQPAINAVAEGGTVNVAAGLYNERLTISESLDLRGAQYGEDPTAAGARTTAADESIIEITGLGDKNPNVAVEIASGVSNVSVAGFTLIGGSASQYADESVIRCWEDDIVIEDNIIDGKVGVLYKGGDTLTVHQNRMVVNKNGVVVQPNAATDVTISDNVFTLGTNPVGDEAGIYMTSCSESSVTGNTITGFLNNAALHGSNLDRLTVSGNTFTGNAAGISIFGGSIFITISNNDLSDSLISSWGDSGCGICIKGADLVITGNKIRNNADIGVKIDRHQIDTERVTISQNNIVGNTNYGVWVNTAAVPETVDAPNNWWGSANGPTHAGNTFNVDEQGDAVSDLVDFVPWNDTDMTGDSFAPIALAGAEDYSSIQAAIDAADPNDTINVAAGTYDENIVVGEQLTLEGAQAGEDPTVEGDRTDPAEESIIQGSGGTAVTISADGVVIDGFTITNSSGKHGIYALDQSNITITNNIVTDVGSSDGSTSGTNWGIKFQSWNAAVDAITITGNQISNIVGGNNKSAQGIVIGDSNGVEHVTNLLIQDNVISNITSATGPSWAAGGRVAYGILLSHGTGTTGKTVDAQVLDNTISYLEGFCAHGIGLEGNTPGAVVERNDISHLTDHKSYLENIPDAVAVQVEDNASADTVGIHFNNFSDVLLGVWNKTETNPEVDAAYNWWGAIGGPGGEGSGKGNSVSANVDYDPWLTKNQADTVSEGIAYFGSTISLEPGWNTLSVPLKLKDNDDSAKSANTMADIVALGDFLISSGTAKNWELAYQYNPKLTPQYGGWENIGTNPIDLAPCRGYYIKTLAEVNFPVLYSGTLGLPALELSAGWNLIGSGFGIDKTDYGIAATTTGDVDGRKKVATALYSIKDKCSVVVSPSTQGQEAAWGTTVIDSDKDMIVGEAYWVFMTAPATLAGFEVTPIYYLP